MSSSPHRLARFRRSTALVVVVSLVAVLLSLANPKIEPAPAEVCTPDGTCVLNEETLVPLVVQLAGMTLEAVGNCVGECAALAVELLNAACEIAQCANAVQWATDTLTAAANAVVADAIDAVGDPGARLDEILAILITFVGEMAGLAQGLVAAIEPLIWGLADAAGPFIDYLAATATGLAEEAVPMALWTANMAVELVVGTGIPAAMAVVAFLSDLLVPYAEFYAQYVQDAAGNPAALLQPVLGLVDTAVTTAGQVVAGLQPTVDQATATALGTLAGTLATVQDTLTYVLSQVPGDPSSTVLGLAATLLPTVLGVAGQAQALANSGPAILIDALGLGAPDGDNNTGDGGAAGQFETDPSRLRAMAEKEFIATQAEADITYALLRYSSPTTEEEMAPLPFHCYLNPLWMYNVYAADGQCPQPAGTATPAPRWDTPSGILTGHPIYQQAKRWSCGPSAGRAVLHYMTGIDHTEDFLIDHMGSGAGYGSHYERITDSLNDLQSQDVFYPEFINGPEELMSRVALVVRGRSSWRHAAILNVNQTALYYWERPPEASAKHYNFAFGYDFRDKGFLTLGDGGTSAVARQPWEVPLEQAYKAVKQNKSLVIW